MLLAVEGDVFRSGARFPVDERPARVRGHCARERSPWREENPTIARANLSIYFDTLQGRLGRATFTRTKFGTVVRESVDAVQPNTAAQVAVKGRFRRVAADWNALTAAQKAAWQSWAAGQRRTDADTRASYAPTGYNAFARLALVWRAANRDVGAPPATPPALAYAGESVVLTAQARPGGVLFSASAHTGPDTVVELWLQPLRNASRKPAANGYRLVAYADLTENGDLDALVPAAPGAYAARYAFVDKATGQRTAFVTLPVAGAVS